MLDSRIYWLKNRTLIRVSGGDSFRFLQNLITNDLNVPDGTILYTALLTPQGKYLFDFFIIKESKNVFLIDILFQAKANFLGRLKMYRLRADVKLEEVIGRVAVSFFEKPKDAFRDPRCEKMGWRKYFTGSTYSKNIPILDTTTYDKFRVDNLIPETDIELIREKTFILEAGFNRLSGVSFTKGCYVGQEVTARMRHKTELQKGLAKVQIFGEIPELASDVLSQEKRVGTLFTRAGEHAIAFLKFKYNNTPLNVGDAEIVLVEKF